MTLHLPIANCGEVVLDVPHYFIKLLIGQLGIQCMNTETVLTHPSPDSPNRHSKDVRNLRDSKLLGMPVDDAEYQISAFQVPHHEELMLGTLFDSLVHIYQAHSKQLPALPLQNQLQHPVDDLALLIAVNQSVHATRLPAVLGTHQANPVPSFFRHCMLPDHSQLSIE